MHSIPSNNAIAGILADKTYNARRVRELNEDERRRELLDARTYSTGRGPIRGL